MQARLTAGLVVIGLLALAASALSAPPAAPQTREFTLVAEPIACDTEPDGVCLGYNGEIPGPMLDVNLGDTLVVTLVNRYTAPVSWHVHGTALAADVDGIPAHAGTRLIESVAHPGGSFTYTARAAYAGSWHYHDHALGPDGSEGVRRGLYGGLVVRSGGEPRAEGATFDLHVLDTWTQGGLVLDKTVAAGSDFEVLVVGLGNTLPVVQLRSPQNALLDSAQLGPGMSDRFRVDDAQPGAYTLRIATTTIGRVEVV